MSEGFIDILSIVFAYTGAAIIFYGGIFLVASDILKTIVAPSQQDILLLGATVTIRTVMGYFLTKEANFGET